ncbi:MAG: DUF2256 domain-containing protein [Pseudomonadota bacterium]
MRAVKKMHLPEKVCPVCQRPFRWRKRWTTVWAEVRYCSDACRRRRHLRSTKQQLIAPRPARSRQ